MVDHSQSSPPEGIRQDRYGSDLIVELLGDLGIRYAALNPGASLRGMHESLTQAEVPELILALHEEIAVAIAHGYAKVGGDPMVVLLHDLVGLQHASMAIFNAFIDQVPMLILGGSGPADATRRRPWIDWIHAPRWQSLAVRDIVKWDDEPRSLDAALSSVTRAHRFANLTPQGPTYVAIDALLQEETIASSRFDLAAIPPPQSVTATEHDLSEVASILTEAAEPVIVADMVARSPEAFEGLRQLAEVLAAPVIDMGGRHNFSNVHWADCTDGRADVLARADAVLCLDARDTRWALSEIDLRTHSARSLVRPGIPVITIGLNELRHHGHLDLESPVIATVNLVGDSSSLLHSLAHQLQQRLSETVVENRRQQVRSRSEGIRSVLRAKAAKSWDAVPISRARLAAEVWSALHAGPWVLANGSLAGWARRTWTWEGYGSYLGGSGGAGLGYGVGATIGAALALRDEEAVVVDLQPDGDLLYTPSALWTAARYRLPLLIVMDNNRTYGKDRLHQSVMATARGRGKDRIDIGIDIDDPAIDFAELATAQGVEAFGPITDPAGLAPTLARAIDVVRSERRPALVDVVTGRD